MFDRTDFANRLAELRNKKDVSARDMSLSLGQNPGYINSIENNKAMPGMETFFYICDYLEITPKDFFDTDVHNPAQVRRLISIMNQLNDEDLETITRLVSSLAKKK